MKEKKREAESLLERIDIVLISNDRMEFKQILNEVSDFLALDEKAMSEVLEVSTRSIHLWKKGLVFPPMWKIVLKFCKEEIEKAVHFSEQ